MPWRTARQQRMTRSASAPSSLVLSMQAVRTYPITCLRKLVERIEHGDLIQRLRVNRVLSHLKAD
jgi:hypothetical protein